eukprot:m.882257 g.882257  ORF g.882257 m.882257 type:complete len:60 (+) comp23597_c0_seq19:665-844(+)
MVTSMHGALRIFLLFYIYPGLSQKFRRNPHYSISSTQYYVTIQRFSNDHGKSFTMETQI